MNNNDIVVYTAIMGEYDILRPVIKPGNAQWVAFVDHYIEPVDGWEIREMTRAPEPALAARWYKTAATSLFFGIKNIIWLDGSIIPTVTPEHIVKTWLPENGPDIACFKHPGRNCAYDEARRCIVKGKASPEVINRQIQAYTAAGFPPNNGLVETGVVLRRNTLQVEQLERQWWRQIRDYSHRDQVSLPYCLWLLGMEINVIEGSLIKHPWFSFKAHSRNVPTVPAH